MQNIVSLSLKLYILSYFLCLHATEKNLLNENVRKIAEKVIIVYKRQGIEDYNAIKHIKKIHKII